VGGVVSTLGEYLGTSIAFAGIRTTTHLRESSIRRNIPCTAQVLIFVLYMRVRIERPIS
jgi:hypothetical protein